MNRIPSGVGAPIRFFLIVAIAFAFLCVSQRAGSAGELWWARTVAEFPHDPAAFTQGLIVHEGKIYESTGKYGKSSLRVVDIDTGRVARIRLLNSSYFGEGITIFGDRLYQLTWRKHVIFIYDPKTFDILETVPYDGEGWGLTHDDSHLILSDGTDSIRFLDPETLKIEREITVHEGAEKVTRLNELEYVRGEIWANIWYGDRVVRISPDDGSVLGWIDLSSLSRRSKQDKEDVLNGIAYDAPSDRLFVTGKNWSTLYEIKVMAP